MELVAGVSSSGEDIEKHNRVLLHALQTARPVIYDEKKSFIQVLTYAQSGGGIETIVYLAGKPEPVAPDLITLAPEIT